VSRLLDYLRGTWWCLLVAATVSGIVSGLVLAVSGVLCSHAIATYLTHDKQTTELGDAALAIYVFFTFGATGFIAAFSGTYGIVRRRGYAPVAITGITLGINILGFYEPTGGYALLPLYSSIVIGLGLTVGFLMLRPASEPMSRPEPPSNKLRGTTSLPLKASPELSTTLLSFSTTRQRKNPLRKPVLADLHPVNASLFMRKGEFQHPRDPEH
jgi:hypothetical protein